METIWMYGTCIGMIAIGGWFWCLLIIAGRADRELYNDFDKEQ
jgi:hypothetical protein